MPKNRQYFLNALFLLLFIFSCSRKPDDNRIPLRFMFWGGFIELQIWEKVEQIYEKMYPNVNVILEYSPVAMSDYDKKLRMELINGTAPDVAMVDDDLFPSYTMYGHLENLEPYIQADSAGLNFADFIPTSLETFTYQSIQYALPFDGFCTLIVYNQEIFDKYHLPYPDDNWTWEDFRKTAWLLTFDFDNDGRVDQFGCDVGETFFDMENILWSYGAEIMDENREYFTMNSPQAGDALQFVLDLKYKFHCQPRWGEMSILGSEIQILTGRIAMKLAPVYILMNLFAVSSEGLRWGIAHIPTGPSGKASRVSWDGLAIYAKSKHKPESWNLLKCILSPEIQRTIGRLKRAVPVRLSDAKNSFADSTTPQPEEKYIEGFEYGRMTPVTDKIGKTRHLYVRYIDRIKINSITDDSIAAQINRLQDYSLNKDLSKYEALEKIKTHYRHSPQQMLKELEEEMREIYPPRRIDKKPRKTNP
jgi:multiple sugar transport system substrate-binding protein